MIDRENSKHQGSACARLESGFEVKREWRPRKLVSALLVGGVHGLAGSAALVLLTLGGIGSPGLGFSYMALFGIGSLAGMVALSGAIAVPLRLTELRLTWAYNGLTAVVGLV